MRTWDFLQEDDNENINLKTDYAYYYQEQMQMKFAHTQYCDFLAWRKEDFIVDRILPDVSFIDDALAKANIFVKTALLPQLIGRWFTKQQTISVPPANQTIPDHVSSTSADASSTSDDNILWCYCQKDDSADNIIGCDNDECPYQCTIFLVSV